MGSEDIDVILGHVRDGGKIFFGRDSLGRGKVKVKYGPFKMFTRRFYLNPSATEALKVQLHRMG